MISEFLRRRTRCENDDGAKKTNFSKNEVFFYFRPPSIC
jgi:hypothetical protein